MRLPPSSDKAALRPPPWLRQGKDGFPTLPLCRESKGQATDELERKLKPLQKAAWCLETDGRSWGWTSFGVSPSGSDISRRWTFLKTPDLLNPSAHGKFQLCSPGCALTDPPTLVTREGEKAKRGPLGKLPSCTVSSHFQPRPGLCRLRVLCWPRRSERLCAGGARNSSAIPRAKGQSSA